jgi:hypothetical protein
MRMTLRFSCFIRHEAMITATPAEIPRACHLAINMKSQLEHHFS